MYPTPGRSLALPPCTKTLLYLEQRYPEPGIRVVTFKPLVRLTLATCRTAEFGFLGLIVVTFVTIPFRCGFCFRRCVRGVYDLEYNFVRKEVCFNVAKFKLKKGRFVRRNLIRTLILVNLDILLTL